MRAHEANAEVLSYGLEEIACFGALDRADVTELAPRAARRGEKMLVE
jgi:hypothetical protein